MAILTRSSKTPDLNSSRLEKHNNASEALSFAINLFMCNIPSFMLKSVHTYIKKPDKKQCFWYLISILAYISIKNISLF